MGLRGRLKVNEIFQSLQGEGSRAGRPCFFIRLTGCPLRCVYCDTTYAFQEGRFWDLEHLVQEVVRRLGPPRRGPNAPFVEVTGGEPLAQPRTPELLARLLDLGHEVALETAGAHDLGPVPPAVIKIVDRKTPGSGEAERWREDNLDWMVPGQDELKLVLCGPEDYAWARAWCEARHVWDRFEVVFSPAHGRLDPRWLAERILEDGLPVRFQFQLHKLIWPPDARGV
jgi:7-carboxy-7-deazaguanine synthase